MVMKRALLKMLTLTAVAFGWIASPSQAAESIRIGYIPVLAHPHSLSSMERAGPNRQG